MSLADYLENGKEQSESNLPSVAAAILYCRGAQVDFCAGII